MTVDIIIGELITLEDIIKINGIKYYAITETVERPN